MIDVVELKECFNKAFEKGIKLREKKMHITINLPPRTKKNSSRIVMRGKYPRVLPSKAFEQFQNESIVYLARYRNLEIDYPINLKCLFYQDANRKSDLVGFLQAIQDILVHYNVIQDDNNKIVQSTDGSRVFVDKNNPRVEIEITKIVER